MSPAFCDFCHLPAPAPGNHASMVGCEMAIRAVLRVEAEKRVDDAVQAAQRRRKVCALRRE